MIIASIKMIIARIMIDRVKDNIAITKKTVDTIVMIVMTAMLLRSVIMNMSIVIAVVSFAIVVMIVDNMMIDNKIGIDAFDEKINFIKIEKFSLENSLVKTNISV